jgi:hypothetical protein
MENMIQYADGTFAFVNTRDSVKDLHLGGSAATSSSPRLINERVAVLKLAAADTGGGVFAWNPGVACIVTRVVLHVTTESDAACTLDIGIAANGTTLNDTLIDGVDVGTAAGIFDNIEDAGTNGLARLAVTATQYLTASKASGAAAGLVGYAYVHYYPTF